MKWFNQVSRSTFRAMWLGVGLVVIVAVALIWWLGANSTEEQRIAALIAEAQQAYTDNNLTEAHNQYQAILNRYPNNHLALNGMGNVLRDQGDLAGAEKMYLKVITVQPQYEFVYRNLLTTYQMWPDAAEKTIKLSGYSALIQKGLAANGASAQIVGTALDYYHLQGDENKANELEQKLSALI